MMKPGETSPLMNVAINKPKDEKNDTFIFATSVFEEFRIMFMLFIPITFSNVCEYVPQWIAYSFIGHLPNSTILLASVGLSMAFTNCIGISILWGLSKGLDTLIPHALGQSDHINNINARIKIYFQQGVITTFIILIPILCLQYFAGDIMCLIGQSKDLCTYINYYCRALIPLVIGAWWYSLLCRLLRPLNLNNQNMFINIIPAIISYPLNYLFISYLEYNYIATAVIMDICIIQVSFGTTLLLIYKGYGFVFKPDSFNKVFNKLAIKNYLYLSVPTMIANTGDWWIAELILILSGYIYNPSIAVAATSIATALDAIIAEINLSVTTPLSIRIGKYIGFGSVKYGKRAMYIGLLLSFMVISMLVIISLLFRNIIPYIWISNNNQHVGNLTSNLIYFVCLRELFYNSFAALSSIFIGLGKQKYTATISTICNFCIVLPLTMILLFYFDFKDNESYYGLYIIWGFNSLGFALTSIILVLMTFNGYINWNKAVNESQTRLKQTIPSYGALQKGNNGTHQ